MGVDAYGVHHLAGEADKHPGMREVLFDHLSRDYSEYVRSRMAAALGGPKITDDEFDRLVTAYRSERSDRVRQQFADAVSKSGPKHLDTVLELIRDTSLGTSRVLLVKALTRSKKPEARETLEELRDDPDLKPEIGRRLKG